MLENFKMRCWIRFTLWWTPERSRLYRVLVWLCKHCGLGWVYREIPMPHCHDYLPRTAISVYRQCVEFRLKQSEPLEVANKKLFKRLVILEHEMSRMKVENEFCKLGRDATEHVRNIFGINEDGSLQ